MQDAGNHRAIIDSRLARLASRQMRFNRGPYTAQDTRCFARDIGLVPRTTPVESPQSNGMAEAFVRTLKRDYARVSAKPDAQSVIDQLPIWLDHYNEVHPHRALGYRSPREFIAISNREDPSGL
jgi:putative transposase